MFTGVFNFKLIEFIVEEEYNLTYLYVLGKYSSVRILLQSSV